MTEQSDSLDEATRFIKQKRDELKLKMHLAGNDAQDEWDALESKWQEFAREMQPLSDAFKEAGQAAGEQAGKVASAAEQVTPPEVKEGFEKLRSELKEGYEKLGKILE